MTSPLNLNQLQQVAEGITNHFCNQGLSSVYEWECRKNKMKATILQALRDAKAEGEARIKELEQALRLNLAVGQDDPIIVDPLEKQLLRVRDNWDAVSRSYDELIYAVGKKYPGETRHQTALRYIREREQSSCIESIAQRTAGGRDDRL